MSKASRQRVTGWPAALARRPLAGDRGAGAGVLACALGLAGWPGAAWPQAALPAAPGVSQAMAPSEPAVPPTINRPPSFSINARAAITNNGGLDDNGMRQGDFITSIRPEVAWRHESHGLSADLRAAATLVDYANGTQPDGALPDVGAAIKSTLVDRWLYLDATGYVRSAEADPFGVRTDDVITANRRIESGYVIAPYLKRDFGPNSSLLVREQYGTARNVAGENTRIDTNASLIRFERKPTPLGMSAELSRIDNRASDQGESYYTLTTGRLRGDLKVADEIELGAIVGEDRSDYLLSRHDDPLYGAAFDWTPGPRTRLQFELEHRYFGQSGLFRFDHRSPFLAVAVELRRQPVDAVSSLGTFGPGRDLRSALNSILTTRYPDPATRAGIVDGIVASRGLDTRGAGAINIVGDYPQLQSAGQVALTLLGTLNTFNVSAYAVTTRALIRADDPFSPPAAGAADTRQRGGTFQFDHRLGPQLSASLVANWSRIEGLSTSAGDRSDQQIWRASLLRTLTLRSDLSVAVQWYKYTTTAPGRQSFDATLAFVGLNHRF